MDYYIKDTVVWDLPWETHKRFVESLTEVPHLQSTLHSRYAGFIDNLKHSKKTQLNLIFHLCKDDLSTQTGQSIAFLLKLYDFPDVTSLLNNKKEIMTTRVNALEPDEDWKATLIEELSLARLGFVDLNLESAELDLILDEITTA